MREQSIKLNRLNKYNIPTVHVPATIYCKNENEKNKKKKTKYLHTFNKPLQTYLLLTCDCIIIYI